MDPFEQFKQMQKQGWAHFAPLEVSTTPPAAQLVKFANIHAGQRVLDVACGTGVVAITAARAGAQVTALDLTPELLARARENAQIAGVSVDFHEGDAEKLPFGDAEFDVVLSQYGHMFAPRPEIALAEMLRVLKPGGTIAFSTWPPDKFIGQTFSLIARNMPPPPPGAASPVLWGDQKVIEQRLGSSVRDTEFRRGAMIVSALSIPHFRGHMEKTAGPLIRLVQTLGASDPEKLAGFRREFDALASQYCQDNTVSQEYLMTRATKV